MTDDGQHSHVPSRRVVIVVGVAILALLWLAPTVASWVNDLDLAELEHLYLLVFTFVVFDAVIPIFPSESLLTTGSNLAALDGSTISVWHLALAGAAGAIVGDSLLYWVSRTFLRRSMSDQVDRAERNPKVSRSLEVLSRNASLLIVFGRFVPGLRFIVGATMGMSRFPYPRFLFWDVIGGVLWAFYTCGFSYLIATVIDDKPVLSIAVSVVVTTAVLGLLYLPLKRSWVETDVAPEPDAARPGP